MMTCDFATFRTNAMDLRGRRCEARSPGSAMSWKCGLSPSVKLGDLPK